MFNYLIFKKIQVIINLAIVVLQISRFSFFQKRQMSLRNKNSRFLANTSHNICHKEYCLLQMYAFLVEVTSLSLHFFCALHLLGFPSSAPASAPLLKLSAAVSLAQVVQ